MLNFIYFPALANSLIQIIQYSEFLQQYSVKLTKLLDDGSFTFYIGIIGSFKKNGS